MTSDSMAGEEHLTLTLLPLHVTQSLGMVCYFERGNVMPWILSSSSDRVALDIVDGVGLHEGEGPHYSRRTPGSKTFTGVGREIVLTTLDRSAVWAVVRQKNSSQAGERRITWAHG